MSRARLVVNPSSGTDRALPLLPMVTERLRRMFETLDVTITTGVADAERAAAAALSERCDALYVAGGDGTINAVLRGLLAGGGPSRGLPVGVIPAGTGNDFSKALALGENPEEAVDALLERRVVDVDLGTLNGRPFVNASAGGFVADVSDAVTEGLKDVTGKLAYLIGGARVLFGSEPFAAALSAEAENGAEPRSWSGDIRMFAACNARFIGGGYPIAPAASLDDGLLDVLVVPAMPLLEFIAVLQKIASGDAPASPGVLHFRASRLELEFSRIVRVNTDGEVLETGSCRYEVRSRSVRFFCGTSPHVGQKPIRI